MRALSAHAHARRPQTSRAARPLLLLPWRARVDHVSRREADAPPPLAPAASAAPTFCCTASAVRQRAAARALRTTRTEAGAADARGSARPLVSRRAAASAAARCSVRVATAASVVVMAPWRASAVAAVRASGTSALLLVACPSVSACAALSAARAQCDASDGPSRFPPRPVRVFPLIRNPRAGALARSEERRQQGPPPQVSDKNSSSTLQEPFLKLTNSIKHPNLPQQNSNAVQKKRRYPLIKFSRAFAASWS